MYPQGAPHLGSCHCYLPLKEVGGTVARHQIKLPVTNIKYPVNSFFFQSFHQFLIHTHEDPLN